MITRIKNWLESHPKEYELLRYLIAGGLSTLVSMIVSYGVSFLLAESAPMDGGVIAGVIARINRATAAQVSFANTLSWIVAVLFAFWINRGMVFRAQNSGNIRVELFQFAAGRIVSFLLFEQGMMLVLKSIGVSNVVNRLAVLIFVVVFNYIISKYWIFKQKQ